MGNSCCSYKEAARGETSSLCTTEGATGVHNFVVMNYSLLYGMGVGKFVASSTFSVGGQDWCIRFYPDGDGREPGYAATRLPSCEGVAAEKGVRVYYTLSLREKDGRVHSASTQLTATQTFTSSGVTGMGSTKLVHKSNLQTTESRSDRFTIRCELTVVQNTIVQMMLPVKN